MDREELLALDKEVLVELIVRLHERVTELEARVGFEPARTFGPRVEALLGYLHYGHHLSHERLVAVCASVFGLRISEGAIAAALARLAARAEPEVAAIREAVRASPAVNSDETGVRVDGRNWWHWVFQTPAASYHDIAPSRGADVVARFLGEARPEVWGSDAFPTQFVAPAGRASALPEPPDPRPDLRRGGRRAVRATVGTRPAAR